MAKLSREEVLGALKAFQERRGDEVLEQTKTSLTGMFLAAANNEGSSKDLRFVRAYQASFDVASVDGDELGLEASELSSFLRLDLGDGQAEIAPSQGLISGIFALQPKLMGQLDLAAIADSARTSVATGTKTRVNLSTDGSSVAVSDAIRANPEAQLVGEIVLGDRRPPTAEVAVEFANAIVSSGAEFALSNVVDAKQFDTFLTALHAKGLKPASADFDFSIGRDLGQQNEAGEKAFTTAKEIFAAAKAADVQVTVSAIAVGQPEARKALFAAAEEAYFGVESLRISGRDLMAETVGLGRELPSHTVQRSTGMVLS